MAIEEAKARVETRIWQSIATSGVQVSSIPQDQLNALVSAIADGVLVAIDHEFEEAGLPSRGLSEQAGPAAQAAASSAAPGGAPGVAPSVGDEEKLLWEGRPFLSVTTYYRITSQRVRAQHGIVGRENEDIELIRIQDLDRSQTLTQRMLGIGDIAIISGDPSHPKLVLENVADVDQVHEILRQAMLNARKKYRYSIQEEI